MRIFSIVALLILPMTPALGHVPRDNWEKDFSVTVSQATGGLFRFTKSADKPENDLEVDENGFYRLREGRTSATRNSLSCTGFLVGHNQLMTAGHCLNPKNYPLIQNMEVKGSLSLKVYFGRQVKNIPESEIYSIKKILKARYSYFFGDFALLELDRSVPNIKPLVLGKTYFSDFSTNLLFVGHDRGTLNVTTIKDFKSQPRNGLLSHLYFESSTHLTKGSSGSPIVNSRTGEVVGLISGLVGFEFKSTQVQRITTISSQTINTEFQEHLFEGNLLLARALIDTKAIDLNSSYTTLPDGRSVTVLCVAIIRYMKFGETDSIQFLIENNINIDENALSMANSLKESGDPIVYELFTLERND